MAQFDLDQYLSDVYNSLTPPSKTDEKLSNIANASQAKRAILGNKWQQFDVAGVEDADTVMVRTPNGIEKVRLGYTGPDNQRKSIDAYEVPHMPGEPVASEKKMAFQRQQLANQLGLDSVTDAQVEAQGLVDTQAFREELYKGQNQTFTPQDTYADGSPMEGPVEPKINIRADKLGRFGRPIGEMQRPDGLSMNDYMQTPERNAAYGTPWNRDVRNEKRLKKLQKPSLLENLGNSVLAGAKRTAGMFIEGASDIGKTALKEFNNISDQEVETFNGMRDTVKEINYLKKQNQEGKLSDDDYEKYVYNLEGKLTEEQAELYVNQSDKLETLEYISDKDDYIKEVKNVVGKAQAKVDRTKQNLSKKDSDVITKNWQENLSDLQEAYNSGDVLGTAKSIAKFAGELGFDLAKFTYNNPEATLETFAESLPQMLASKNPVGFMLTTSAFANEKVNEAIELYKETHNGEIPTGDAKDELVAKSIASAMIAQGTDRALLATGKALGLKGNTKSIVKDTAKMVGGAGVEAVGEFTENVLDQSAGKQGAAPIDYEQATHEGALAAGSGPVIQVTGKALEASLKGTTKGIDKASKVKAEHTRSKIQNKGIARIDQAIADEDISAELDARTRPDYYNNIKVENEDAYLENVEKTYDLIEKLMQEHNESSDKTRKDKIKNQLDAVQVRIQNMETAYEAKFVEQTKDIKKSFTASPQYNPKEDEVMALSKEIMRAGTKGFTKEDEKAILNNKNLSDEFKESYKASKLLDKTIEIITNENIKNGSGKTESEVRREVLGVGINEAGKKSIGAHIMSIGSVINNYTDTNSETTKEGSLKLVKEKVNSLLSFRQLQTQKLSILDKLSDTAKKGDVIVYGKHPDGRDATFEYISSNATKKLAKQIKQEVMALNAASLMMSNQVNSIFRLKGKKKVQVPIVDVPTTISFVNKQDTYNAVTGQSIDAGLTEATNMISDEYAGLVDSVSQIPTQEDANKASQAAMLQGYESQINGDGASDLDIDSMLASVGIDRATDSEFAEGLLQDLDGSNVETTNVTSADKTTTTKKAEPTSKETAEDSVEISDEFADIFGAAGVDVTSDEFKQGQQEDLETKEPSKKKEDLPWDENTLSFTSKELNTNPELKVFNNKSPDAIVSELEARVAKLNKFMKECG